MSLSQGWGWWPSGWGRRNSLSHLGKQAHLSGIWPPCFPCLPPAVFLLMKQEVCPAQLISSENACVTLPFPQLQACSVSYSPPAQWPQGPTL